MNTDENKRDHKDNNPTSPDRREINPANRNREESRNPDSDNDRKGSNRDINREDRGNEIRGREQQTTPKNKAEEIADRFNSREEKQKQKNNS